VSRQDHVDGFSAPLSAVYPLDGLPHQLGDHSALVLILESLNHLVANLVILYNVEQMSCVLSELRDEEVEISPEVLAGLSPYRTSHINRFGDYTVDTSRTVTPIDFARRILSEANEATLDTHQSEALM